MKSYTKTDWHDHIVDIEAGDIIQEGTRFTASRANNIEDGIGNMYVSFAGYETELQKLRVQLEMVGRAPINNGTFYDTLDGETPKQLTRLLASAVSQATLAVGATTITLDSVPFKVGEYVTVYDDAQSETGKVTAVGATTITVTALAKAYKKGAYVRRTSAKFDDVSQVLKFGNWGNYTVTMTEVV